MEIKNINLSNLSVNDASILNSNMLLYLDANNPTSYPGSGTSWYDLSVNTNNCVNLTGTSYSNLNGGFIGFNGSGYGITASAKYNTPYTGKSIFIAGRLSSAMTTNSFRCMFGSSGGNRNFNIYLYCDPSNRYSIHYSAAGYGGFSSVISYTPGNWFTVGVTHTTGNLVSYYYNGQLVSTQPSVPFSQYLSSTSEYVGASDNYWYGALSVVCIYKTTITAQDMFQNHNAVRTRYGLS